MAHVWKRVELDYNRYQKSFNFKMSWKRAIRSPFPKLKSMNWLTFLNSAWINQGNEYEKSPENRFYMFR